MNQRPVVQLRAADRRAGFTFLEVMLVVMIAGLLVAVALPNFRPASQAAELNQSARRVVAMCRYARAYAISHQEYAYIDFDLEAQIMTLGTATREKEEDDPAFRARQNRLRRRGDVPDYDASREQSIAEHQFPRGVRVYSVETWQELFWDAGKRVRIYFYPTGRASRATIVMASEAPARDGSGDTRLKFYAIEVYHATGMVYSKRGKPEEPNQGGGVEFAPLAGRRAADEDYTYLVQERRR